MEWKKTSSSFPAMGTVMRITVYSRRDPNEALLAAKRRYEELDQRLSHYKADSEVSLLQPGRTVRVSPELFTILKFAQRLSLLTAGAFDVTLGNYQHLMLGKQTVSLTREGMRLDLGGIAKGFANDEAARVLRSRGISRYLLAASGDILVGDAPPGEPGWRVGLQNTERVLRRRAVSTSGNTYQPGHVQDSRSGGKVMGSQTVSVLAPESMTADALATACFILKPEERQSLLRSYRGAEAVSE